MGLMTSVTYDCVFCGEENDVLVDPSGGRHQTFTEDCTVCCRPEPHHAHLRRRR